MFKKVFAAMVAAQLLCAAGWARDYPARPVRIVVGFGTGGPDTTARLVAAQLTAQMGQSFVVDNRPGASGTLGAEIVAKANPDGYTLLVAPNSFAINPSIFKKLPFDVFRDFIPISHTSSSEAAFVVVHPGLPVQTLKDLIAYARKPENKVSYGSPGIGSGLHLRTALFGAKAGTSMVHVPYKGAGPAITGLLGGEVQMMFVTVTVALPHIKSGKLRALAYDHTARAPFMPEIPTMTEAGAPPTKVGPGWHGLFAPAKTPPAIVARLETEVRKAVRLPDVQQQFIKLGLVPAGSTSAELKVILADSVKAMAEAVRAANIQPE